MLVYCVAFYLLNIDDLCYGWTVVMCLRSTCVASVIKITDDDDDDVVVAPQPRSVVGYFNRW